MENKRKHNASQTGNETIYNFPEIDLHYPVTKEEIWNRISAKLDSDRYLTRKKFTLASYPFALAASILLLLGITLFMKFHTVTTYCPSGQHLTVSLPDHSNVELNAESSISYYPYRMKFDRSINLKGEAYFKVNPGKRFKVISKNGETVVLGTTFNVYARDGNYNVSCFTGSVKVISALNKESVILHPSQQAIIQPDGTFKLIQMNDTDASKAWMQNMFVFTAAPLKAVIQEIERQYNIKIKTEGDYPLTYTGNFNKSISEKEVLDLLCTSLNLKFEVKSNGEYLIYKN